MSHSDDHDDNDPNSDEFLAESEHHFDKLYERISGYMDEGSSATTTSLASCSG
jgi:hypothetical protein